MKKKVLIVDFEYIGHHLHFIRLYAEALLGKGCQVIVAIPEEARGTNEFKVHLDDLKKDIEFVFHSSYRGAGDLKKLIFIWKLVRGTRISHVYLPIADGILQLATFLQYKKWPGIRGIPHEGCLFRGSYADGEKRSCLGRIKQKLNERLVGYACFDRIYFLNLGVLEYLQSKAYPVLKKAVAMPEPLEPPSDQNRDDLCAQLGLDPANKYVLSLGVQSLRKGSHLLIEAFCKAKLPETCCLLIAGKVLDEVRPVLNEAKTNADSSVILIDRYLSDHEFFGFLDCADVVAVPYLRHSGSSGIVNRAIIRNKILTGNSFGYMGTLIEKYYRGVLHSDSVASIVDALETCVAGIPDRRDDPFVRTFSAFHTEINFKNVVTKGIV